MTSRLRERRKASTRTPSIVRPIGGTGERPVTEHGTRRIGFAGWRFISGIIVLGMLVVLFLFFSTNLFYVHGIAVGGLKYMTKEEVFTLTGIANMHIFWVDPQDVRKNILRSPTIADATVTVGWPPNMVQVIIQEREPALIWVQSGVTVWLDIQGRVMNLREDRPELLRVSSDVNDGPLGPNVQVGVDIVTGALQLKALRSNITELRYDPAKGLGYADGRGWMAWFGTGTEMPEKLRTYEAIVNSLAARGIHPAEVNVVNPDAPYYCCEGQ
jgi:cell division septal protein FtsQ